MKNKNGTIWKIMVEVAAFSSGAIFGPLALFGFLGYWLDSRYNPGGRKFLLIGVGIAFIVTNILLFRKSRSISSLKVIDLIKKNKEDEEE